jgi:TATA-binding protein-associated factor Taf7
MDTAKYNKWLNMSPEDVKSGLNEAGQRHLVEFSEHYKEVTGETLCLTCSFNSKFYKFTSKIKGLNMLPTENKVKKETGFLLKEKYQGVSLGFGSQEMLSHKNMTTEKAVKFYAEHPAGAKLFREVPENIEELVEAYQEEKLTAELLGEETSEEETSEEETSEEETSEEETSEEETSEEETSEEDSSDDLTSGDYSAEQAIAIIEEKPLEQLAGFVQDSEDRVTVLAAWNKKNA